MVVGAATNQHYVFILNRWLVTAVVSGENREAVKVDWRQAYRKLTPEKEPPSIKQLRKHFMEQHLADVPLTGRHANMEERAQKLERMRAGKKARTFGQEGEDVGN